MNPLFGPTRDDLEQVYRAHDPSLAGHQQAEAVVAGTEGITVLCSANSTGDGEHTWLIRLADDGSLKWERHYALDHGTGRAFAALPDGGFVIAGDVQRGAMEYQAQVMRVDAAGVTGGAFGPQGVTGLAAVTVLIDGSILAGGMANGQGWLVHADETWRAIRDLSINDVDEVRGVAPLPDGGFAVAAIQDPSTTSLGMTYLAAYSRDQRVRWGKRLPLAGRAEPAALAVLPDGGLVAVGHHTTSEHAPAQMWVVRVNETGEVLWEQLLGAAGEERRGRAVVPLAGGLVAVAGDAARDGHRSLRVACLDADGMVVWERALSAGERSYDVARGLARLEGGGLVLAGSTTAKGPGKTNVWVLRLDGDGGLLWDRVFGHS